MSIRIGILGYGNLGRGVECAIKQNADMELKAVFTRRNPADVHILTETAKVYSVDEAVKMKDEIDVLILCGGSATDLPVQTPEYAQYFNVVTALIHMQNSGTFCRGRCSSEKERKNWLNFSGLGPGNVLFKSFICKCNSSGRE